MEKIAVLTGASSGIGRAAAVQFTERGYAVVLAARGRENLEETAELCRRAGGRALVVPTDVTDESQVEALRDAALDRFGAIDVWVNNAGVAYFSTLADGDFADHRRVIETNLFGSMHGARAIIPVFQAQRHGVLINVSSILGKTGQAFVPSYVISKFGLRGMSEALRVELADEPDVHVCTVLPYSTDTPQFETAGSRVPRRARAMPPAQSPEKVARAIVRVSERPRREVHIPKVAVAGLAAHWLFPKSSERLLLHALRTWHFDQRPEAPSDGNLYQSSPEPGHVHGDRPPQLGAPRFMLWAARELMKIEADEARRWLVRSRQRVTGARAWTRREQGRRHDPPRAGA